MKLAPFGTIKRNKNMKIKNNISINRDDISRLFVINKLSKFTLQNKLVLINI